MEPLPWRSLTSLWWDLQFKVDFRTTRASVEVLWKFPLVPAQESNPEEETLLLGKSGVLPPEPPVLCLICNLLNYVKFKSLFCKILNSHFMKIRSLPSQRKICMSYFWKNVKSKKTTIRLMTIYVVSHYWFTENLIFDWQNWTNFRLNLNNPDIYRE